LGKAGVAKPAFSAGFSEQQFCILVKALIVAVSLLASNQITPREAPIIEIGLLEEQEDGSTPLSGKAVKL
jgi:hypothetical protein